jgi:hypothetical protein
MTLFMHLCTTCLFIPESVVHVSALVRMLHRLCFYHVNRLTRGPHGLIYVRYTFTSQIKPIHISIDSPLVMLTLTGGRFRADERVHDEEHAVGLG